MKIYIPISLKTTGGTSTFARSFQQACLKSGHSVIFTEEYQYDILLVPVTAPLSTILRAKRRRIPVVHRLDGVHSPTSIAGWKYPLYNLPMRVIRNHLANAIIYQSKFSQAICNQFLGQMSMVNGQISKIIYNGVDTNIFTPIGKKNDLRDNPGQHIIFTAQRFRRRDQIDPLIKSIEIYRDKYHSNTKFVIAGDFVDPLSKNITQTFPRYITHLDPIPHAELAKYQRSADVFVYCHPHPACPNNVLEALASGLPTVGVADGAMPEIVRHGETGFLISPSTHNLRHPRTFSHQQFAHNIHLAITNKEKIGRSARASITPAFTLEHMAARYLRLFEKLLSLEAEYS